MKNKKKLIELRSFLRRLKHRTRRLQNLRQRDVRTKKISSNRSLTTKRPRTQASNKRLMKLHVSLLRKKRNSKGSVTSKRRPPTAKLRSML